MNHAKQILVVAAAVAALAACACPPGHTMVPVDATGAAVFQPITVSAAEPTADGAAAARHV